MRTWCPLFTWKSSRGSVARVEEVTGKESIQYEVLLGWFPLGWLELNPLEGVFQDVSERASQQEQTAEY